MLKAAVAAGPKPKKGKAKAKPKASSVGWWLCIPVNSGTFWNIMEYNSWQFYHQHVGIFYWSGICHQHCGLGACLEWGTSPPIYDHLDGKKRRFKPQDFGVPYFHTNPFGYINRGLDLANINKIQNVNVWRYILVFGKRLLKLDVTFACCLDIANKRGCCVIQMKRHQLGSNHFTRSWWHRWLKIQTPPSWRWGLGLEVSKSSEMNLATSHHKCSMIPTQKKKNMKSKTYTQKYINIFIHIFNKSKEMCYMDRCHKSHILGACARTSSPLPRMENGIRCARSWDAILATPGPHNESRPAVSMKGVHGHAMWLN